MHPIFHAGRNFDTKTFLFANFSVAATFITRIGNKFTRPMTTRTGGLNHEKPLGVGNMSRTGAGNTGLHLPRFRAFTGAGITSRYFVYFNFFFYSRQNFFETDFKTCLEIGTLSCSGSSLASSSKTKSAKRTSSKKLLKNISKRGKNIIDSVKAMKASSLKTGMTKLVVDLALVRVAQDFIGF